MKHQACPSKTPSTCQQNSCDVLQLALKPALNHVGRVYWQLTLTCEETGFWPSELFTQTFCVDRLNHWLIPVIHLVGRIAAIRESCAHSQSLRLIPTLSVSQTLWFIFGSMCEQKHLLWTQPNWTLKAGPSATFFPKRRGVGCPFDLWSGKKKKNSCGPKNVGQGRHPSQKGLGYLWPLIDSWPQPSAKRK